MKKLGIYAVMAVFVGVMSGCLDDDNNYNYRLMTYKVVISILRISILDIT